MNERYFGSEHIDSPETAMKLVPYSVRFRDIKGKALLLVPLDWTMNKICSFGQDCIRRENYFTVKEAKDIRDINTPVAVVLQT